VHPHATSTTIKHQATKRTHAVLHFEFGPELVASTEENPLLGRGGAVGVDAFGLALLDAVGLIERNAQRFRAHGRGLLVLRNTITQSGARTLGLDLVFTLVTLAVGNKDNVLAVERGDKVIPAGELYAVIAVLLVCALEHVLLDLLKKLRYLLGKVVNIDGTTRSILVGNVTARCGNNTLLSASLGPNSIRRGIPLSSQSLNFQPGE
jgi:hypothetical protein